MQVRESKTTKYRISNFGHDIATKMNSKLLSNVFQWSGQSPVDNNQIR
jgi:hypothetical protein